MNNNCKHYDAELDCCKYFSDWTEAMPVLQPCTESHCDKYYPAEKGNKKMKFVLNGCDISFTAEVPEDITLKQLLKQCDKIQPDWCACGICSYEEIGYNDDIPVEIIIGYDSIRKKDEGVSCRIWE